MDIRNPEVFEQIRKTGNLQLSDGIPTALSSNFIASIEVNPELTRRLHKATIGTATVSGAATLLTTDANKTTLIHGASYSIVKDAACDAASGFERLSAIDVDGATATLVGHALLTGTAQDKFLSVQFTKPIELKKNSAISYANTTFTAGNFVRVAVIYYSLIDPQKT